MFKQTSSGVDVRLSLVRVYRGVLGGGPIDSVLAPWDPSCPSLPPLSVPDRCGQMRNGLLKKHTKLPVSQNMLGTEACGHGL